MKTRFTLWTVPGGFVVRDTRINENATYVISSKTEALELMANLEASSSRRHMERVAERFEDATYEGELDQADFERSMENAADGL